MKLIIDAHLDLSWNALSYDRDQTLTVQELRKGEFRLCGKSRGRNTVSLPDMRRGGVGLCLATLLARALPDLSAAAINSGNISETAKRQRNGTIVRENLDYANQEIASAVARGQLAYYRLLEQRGQLRQVNTRSDLDALASQWRGALNGHGHETPPDSLPVGYVLSMEGADPILGPGDAEWWWHQGLRTVCLAHYGPSAYAMGTGGDGPLTDRGGELLRKFDELGMILDLVHTADTALDQAMDSFGGSVFVSHGNCRTLVPGDRQISDEQIKRIAARGGVLGVVFDCWMLNPKWEHGRTHNGSVTLADVANHIDHICQVTGSRAHAAIGSDLDGGYGREQSPSDLDTIADLQNLQPLLASRGYIDADIDAIFHGNWLNFFRSALPA
jgi:membrane dipeptidase